MCFFPDILPKIYENAGLTPCDFFKYLCQNLIKILDLLIFSPFCHKIYKILHLPLVFFFQYLPKMYRIAGLTPYVFSPIFCKKLMKMLDLPRVFFSIFSQKCIELLDLPLFFPDILPKIYENAGLTLFISLFFFFNILSQFDKIDGLRHTPCDFYNICQQNNNKIA